MTIMASELVARASRVGGKVALRNIRLWKLTARQWDHGLAEGTSLQVDVTFGAVNANRQDQLLRIRVPYAVTVKPQEAQEATEPVYRIESEWELVYELVEDADPSPEEITAFATVNGVFSAHPYQRELIHRTSAQLGFPQLMLGLIQSPLEIAAGRDFEIPLDRGIGAPTDS